jgi:hypothetical protein
LTAFVLLAGCQGGTGLGGDQPSAADPTGISRDLPPFSAAPAAQPCTGIFRDERDLGCLDPTVLLLLSDRDHDGLSDRDEMELGLDPDDPHDGPDVDGDNVPNGDDPDVDGDGIPNRHDFDLDGDGLFNGLDPDVDADGLLNHDDPDADGDGLSDRWDLNADGDGKPDDEEDEDDPTKLEDLLEKNRMGKLSPDDRSKIADEIVDRLDSPEAKRDVLNALIDAITLGAGMNRLQPSADLSSEVHAVDAVYRQLSDALADVKKTNRVEKGDPLPKNKLPDVLGQFVPRATAVAELGKGYQVLSLDDLSKAVSSLVTALGSADRALEFAQALRDRAQGAGGEADERAHLNSFVNSARPLRDAFTSASGSDLVDAIDRLRTLASSDGGSDDMRNQRLASLLERMQELARDGETDIARAVTQLEMDAAANDGDGDSQADNDSGDAGQSESDGDDAGMDSP